MNKAFASYQGKRVLITGHTGFKGSWLTIWLKMLGAEVAGLSLVPEEPERCLFNAAGVADGMESVVGDVRDITVVEKVFEAHKPEIVFHLAAQAFVRRSYDDPVDTYTTNVIGTVNVLEMSRRCQSVQALVNVTTDKCYENKEWDRGYREMDRLGGRDVYSSSKACSELVTAAYRTSFLNGAKDGAAVASARAGNVIGGGDWSPDRLVPDTIRSLLRGEAVVLRYPAAVRPWQHVLEPLSGYLLLGSLLMQETEQGAASETSVAEAWNFGPDSVDSITVEELTQRLIELWGEGSVMAKPDESACHEAGQLRLDCSKARERLGWYPLTDVAEALTLTVDWYRKQSENETVARELTEQQIRDYVARRAVQ